MLPELPQLSRPELTQEWAAAYLHITVVLLTFGLGLPSLLIDATASDELRHLVHRRFRLRRWLLLATMFVATAMAFIWIVHPAENHVYRGYGALVGAFLLSMLVLATCVSWFVAMMTYRRLWIVNRLRNRAIRT